MREASASVRIELESLLGHEIASPSPDVRLFEDLALDSTSLLELLMNLEDNVGIEVDPDEISAEVFATIGSLTDYVEKCLARKTA
ncbi:acyl carrier protein [Nonomuraea sp. NPDC050227]|uniref:acyl carrier protein n=1 Tax=unclassified Nonomuraea TaxID=2593643 RepID=UPI00379920CA